MTTCPCPTAVSWLLGLLLACASLWLLALALLTAAAMRDRWRAWRRGPTAEPDDGGPEVDRLAERIAGRLAAHGRLVEGQGRATKADILVELERGGAHGQ